MALTKSPGSPTKCWRDDRIIRQKFVNLTVQGSILYQYPADLLHFFPCKKFYKSFKCLKTGKCGLVGVMNLSEQFCLGVEHTKSKKNHLFDRNEKICALMLRKSFGASAT